jgi:heat shock protein HtpX
MNTHILRRHKLTNWFQSLVLLTGMIWLLAMLGWSLGGMELMLWTIISGVLLLILGPKVSPRWILGMYGARPLTPYDAPQLYSLLGKLAQRARLPALPILYYVPSRIMNAFTVGTQTEAAIAITDGLLRQLTLRELASVLAHEISHIRNNDMWVMTLADLVSRITHAFSLVGQLLILVNLPLLLLNETTISWFAILLLIFAPTISALLQLALSRTREFDADLSAVDLTGDPHALASALIKLEQQQGGFLERLLIPGRHDPEPSLLRTHPGTEERIKRLLSLSSSPSIRTLPTPTALEDPFPLPQHFSAVRRKPYRHITGLWH